MIFNVSIDAADYFGRKTLFLKKKQNKTLLVFAQILFSKKNKNILFFFCENLIFEEPKSETHIITEFVFTNQDEEDFGSMDLVGKIHVANCNTRVKVHLKGELMDVQNEVI